MFTVSCQLLEQVAQTDCEISILRDFHKLDEEDSKHTALMHCSDVGGGSEQGVLDHVDIRGTFPPELFSD